MHCENQNAHRLVADAGYFHSARMQSTLHSEIKKLQVEGQDEDVDDFPSTKVHRRCKKTKSPILLRSKPIVKPILQWAPNGRTDYERQTFISLLLQYLQSKLNQTENKIMYLPTCIESATNLSSVKMSKCQGGISCTKPPIRGEVQRYTKRCRQKNACRKPTGI